MVKLRFIIWDKFSFSKKKFIFEKIILIEGIAIFLLVHTKSGKVLIFLESA